MPTPARVVRFGIFELDAQTGKLRKAGLDVRLQEQPRQVLLTLLERPGQIVGREELRQRLWPDGTFVDFEHSLNTAVKKLRDALGDAADNPRFVETVPLRGYRFIGSVNPPELTESSESALGPARRWRLFLFAGAATLAAAWAAAWWASRPLRIPDVVRSTQVTAVGSVDGPDVMRESFAPLVSDGARLYFSATLGGLERVAQVSVTGGDVVPVEMAIEGPTTVLDLSPDGTRLLVRSGGYAVDEAPLWAVHASTGVAARVGDLIAHAAAWSRDGTRLVYSRGNDLYLAGSDGGNPTRLVSTSGRPNWIRWSPDGTLLRFTLIDSQREVGALWEVRADGTGLRRLLAPSEERVTECCGEWAAGGRYFVFRAARERRSEIWAFAESRDILGRRTGEPRRLVAGPMDFGAALPGRDGRRLFVVGGHWRYERWRYDNAAHAFLPCERGSLPCAALTTRDGQWVADVRDGFLWRSRADGTQRLQLNNTPLMTVGGEWSPDGKRIAVMAKPLGQRWKILLVDAAGGNPQPLMDDDRNEADPTWSPDGRSIIFGRPPDYMAEANVPKAIHVIELSTRRLSTLPGSSGLFSPRWSPDGRYVAALSLDARRLMLFDFTTAGWSELPTPSTGDVNRWSVHNPRWSSDGRFLYFQNFRAEAKGAREWGPIYRVVMRDRRVEVVTEPTHIQRGVLGCGFVGVSADGSPIVGCGLGSSDIFALEWDVR
jgi:Tol biopolymer transport system component/DNA-binding winged helix-turn-helix (wHTH) protein